MYLKRIEVQGFKSFANKITFDFHQGITGIVGPNGSGKSNVSDAVRWVLGEQSARQLRGGNMQDVIFAGTQMRKPLGFAHVALTIDNSHRELAVDFSEVVVARRLYRSGESEYSINGSPCRLRDIQEIFYDTGIGKDGYSIIGQGQVDKILSGRSEERRELFDEAAGITKFKRRKTVALRKLESEENNLLRISDRLEELKKQLEPLKRQSETAREFLHLRETLKQMDASLFVLESKELGERLKEYDEKEGILEEDLARVKTEAETLRRDYNALEEEVMSLEKEAEAIREERDSLSGSMRQQEEKIRNAKEQIRTAQTNTGHFRLRMENIEATLKKNEELSDGYRQRKKQLEMSQREDTGRYEESKKTLEELEGHIHEKEDELAFQNMQKMHLLEERSEFLGSSKKYEALLEQLQIRSSENNRKLLESRSQLEEYTKKETELQEELLEIEEREKKLLSRETEWTAKEEALLNEKARLEKKIADLQYSYQNKTAKLESLRNIAERYEGYGVSIKKIMEAKDRIRGIHGVIADLITVDKNYETAVETALGGRIQNIVTDSEETAKVLIAYLKKNAYGRATFLPLTALQKDNFSPNPSVLSEKGVIGMASDLVETREIYRPLLNRLLGGVYVVEHVDDGIALARKFRHSLRIVTREGELFSPGGAISGGAFKNSSGLLGRKRELEELEDLIAKDEALSLKHASTLSEIQKEWEEWESHRLSLEKERQEEWIKENTCRQSLELLQGQLAAAHVQLSGFLEERERLKKEMEESAMLSRDILASIQEIDERTREDEGLFDASSKEIARLRKEREDLLHRLSEHEIRLAGLHQTRDFLEENLGRLKDEMIGLLEEKEDLAQQVLQNLQRIETEKAEIEDSSAASSPAS